MKHKIGIVGLGGVGRTLSSSIKLLRRFNAIPHHQLVVQTSYNQNEIYRSLERTREGDNHDLTTCLDRYNLFEECKNAEAIFIAVGRHIPSRRDLAEEFGNPRYAFWDESKKALDDTYCHARFAKKPILLVFPNPPGPSILYGVKKFKINPQKISGTTPDTDRTRTFLYDFINHWCENEEKNIIKDIQKDIFVPIYGEHGRELLDLSRTKIAKRIDLSDLVPDLKEPFKLAVHTRDAQNYVYDVAQAAYEECEKLGLSKHQGTCSSALTTLTEILKKEQPIDSLYCHIDGKRIITLADRNQVSLGHVRKSIEKYGVFLLHPASFKFTPGGVKIFPNDNYAIERAPIDIQIKFIMQGKTQHELVNRYL